MPGDVPVKVLIVHPGIRYSVGDVYQGLAKGLRECGVEVGMFNLDDRITFYTQAWIKDEESGTLTKALDEDAALTMAANGIEVALYEWWPDVVVVVSGFYIPPKLWAVLRQRPHHVVYWCTESPYEDDRQGRAARYADTVVLNDPTNLQQFIDEVNPNTHYFPHSYDPDVHRPGPAVPALRSDFAFVGTGFPSRIDWLERVDWTGVNVRIGGNWVALDEDSLLLPFLFDSNPAACMDNLTTSCVYRSTKTSLNLYRKEHSDDATADGWAMGPREVELAACGTFFFRESRPEGDELFPTLPILDGPETFGDELRWWLAHDDEREAAATAARNAIVDRTFKSTAARLLRLVEAAPRKVAA